MSRSNLVTIGEHCKKVSTWNPIQDAPDQVIKYIDIAAIDRESKKIVDVSEILGIDAPSRARQIVMSGDVLVSTVRPNLNAVALVPAEFDGATASTGFTVLRSQPDKLDNSYLFHWVKSPTFVQEMVQQATGASYPAVSDSIVKRSRISLPPLAEQQRIAAILDKSDALREKRRQALAKLDALLQSVFLEMFGDPVTNPKGWPMSSFGAEVTSLEYGPRFYNESYSLSGIRIVRITDLDSLGNLDFEAMPKMDISNEDKAKYCLKPGDLIFARTGATVGKVALISEGDPECIAGAYFIRMRFRERIHPLYAKMVTASKFVQAIIANRSRQSAQQNFSGPGIRSLPLPIPPIEDQLKFQELHTHLVSLGNKDKIQLHSFDRLFSSLQQRAFNGELFTEQAAAAIQQELFAE